MNQKIGITERGDAALNHEWRGWVGAGLPAVLITKAPSKLIGVIDAAMNIIVHCTITGMGGTCVEKNVGLPNIEIDAYRAIVKMMGTERTVLRIDPIHPHGIWLARAKGVAAHLVKGGRMRISFIDLYPHSRQRLADAGYVLPSQSFHAPLQLRKAVWNELGRPEICGEPGLPSTGCISKEDCLILGVMPQEIKHTQRLACACLANKHELLSNREQCPHACAYCYWQN